MSAIEELHKYLDTTVHAYCDYNVYSELKDLVSDVEEQLKALQVNK